MKRPKAIADERGAPVIRRWVVEPPAPDVQRAIERIARAPDVALLAVMPDVHLGHDVCVGVCVATRAAIYPQAVGGDIGCGMTTVALDEGPAVIDGADAAERLIDAMRGAAPPMRHAHRAGAPDPVLTAAQLGAPLTGRLSDAGLQALVAREGRVAFGTLGRGNHFIELQCDEAGCCWLLVHSGSRAMGQAITAHHLTHAGRARGGLAQLRADDERGAAYLADSDWACAYAEANRRCMLHAIAAVVQARIGLRARWETLFSCCHNHVRRERIGGSEYFLHRKGANPAAAAIPGIIAGSMGTETVHTTGRGCADALHSSSHGAGRVLSRAGARNTITPRDLSRQMRGVWFDARLAPHLCEEAPGAYRDLRQVLRAQRELVRVVRRLRPILIYKGV